MPRTNSNYSAEFLQDITFKFKAWYNANNIYFYDAVQDPNNY